VEQHLKDKIWEKFKRYYVSGRWAQVTEPNEIQEQQNRRCLEQESMHEGMPLWWLF
jgi:hypothetical protein